MSLVFAQVFAVFLLFQLVSSQAAGALRNLTISNQDPLVAYSSGWSISESRDPTRGDLVHASDLGESLQVDLPGE